MGTVGGSAAPLLECAPSGRGGLQPIPGRVRPADDTSTRRLGDRVVRFVVTPVTGTRSLVEVGCSECNGSVLLPMHPLARVRRLVVRLEQVHQCARV